MASSSATQPAARTASAVPFSEALLFWIKLGFISFGGPAGQIAIMHQELVEKKEWISERQFLRALNFCMLLPGPEAQQLATYMGWRLHGITGGLTAGILFVLPAVFVLLGLSWLAVTATDIPAIQGIFYGIQAVVVAIVLDAIIRIGRRALTHPALIGFAVGALLALQVMPFPLVILLAALGGFILYRLAPHIFTRTVEQPDTPAAPADAPDTPDAPTPLVETVPPDAPPQAVKIVLPKPPTPLDQTVAPDAPPDAPPPAAEPEPVALPSLRYNLKLIGVFVLLWFVPVALLLLVRGSDDVLFQQAIFFTQAAFVTFGGAYAVLSYIADVAVNNYDWLTASQMIQGLGLAESTPGPLIMVTQYVGFVGAWNLASDMPPLLSGTLGALITTYVTFLPCFLFIFLGAPYIEFLAEQPQLQAALTGVTAAVVGVIANLAIFFGSNVLFPAGWIDLLALALASGAFVLLRFQNMPIYQVVPAGALIGMIGRLLAGFFGW